MILLLQLFKFILGLVLGSFIAALTYRYPRKISNMYGRSFCDNCKRQISWYDNIPLFSFLLLRGKCRNCRKRISLRYPLIELSCAIGFLLIGFQVIPLALLCILAIVFVIDLEYQIIPDIFIFIGIPLSVVVTPHSFISGLFAGLVCASFLLLVHILTKGRGMGLGDVKFAVLGGIIIGLPLSPIWLFVAFLTGAIVGIILILGKKAGLKSKIAFGPFLVIAIPITLAYGEAIFKLIL
jgi:prepilin signal peptidase PulO-like enzyme (type II secretory pathway)